MKRLFLMLCCLIFTGIAAAEITDALPHGRKLHPEDLVAVTFSPEWYFAASPAGNEEIPSGAKPFQRSSDTVDLDRVSALPPKEGNTGVVYNRITASADGLAQIGIGCDWWFEAFVNGREYASTWQNGNDSNAYTPLDNPFLIKVKKGENLLAVKVRRGSQSWKFACGNIPFQQPNLPHIASGPWLANPDAGSMTVRFVSLGEIGSGIELRRKGEKEWQTVWDQKNGRILRRRFHEVHLKALKENAVYEYRIVMLNPGKPTEKIYPQRETLHSFRVPDRNRDEFSFFFTADLQFAPARQQQLLEKLLDAADGGSCDLIVFGGDIGSVFNDMEHDMFERIIATVVRRGGSERPLITVRGNHELRGREAEKFETFFGTPEGRSYAVYRFGNTAFLMLDGWEDKPAASKGADYCKYNLDDYFWQQQTDFLKQAMASDAWKTAKHHIVLCHGAPYSHYDGCKTMPFKLQELTDPYFRGKHSVEKIDLWLAGHTHHYTRSIPGSDKIAALEKPPRPHTGGTDYRYPVLTGSGPGGTPEASAFRVDVRQDKLTVSAYDETGTCFDQIVISDDGGISENSKLPHFDFK